MALLEKQEKVYQEFERKFENIRAYYIMQGTAKVARLIFVEDHGLTLYCHFIGLPMLKGVFLTDHGFSQEGVLLRQVLEDAKTDPEIIHCEDISVVHMENFRFLMDENPNAPTWQTVIKQDYQVLNVIVG